MARVQVAFPWLVDPAPSKGADATADVDLRLAKRGRREPLGALLEQARYSIGLARQHAAHLSKAGWSRARTDGLEADVVLLEAVTATHAEKRSATRTKAQAEQRAIDDVKRFLRLLRTALPMVLREPGASAVDPAAFHVGGELRRSVARIRSYLEGVQEVVLKLDPQLAPYFGGKRPSVTLAKLRAALEHADDAHDRERSARKPVTWKAYEARGRVIQAIEDLHRVARIAFDASPAVRATFHKRILEQARRPRVKPAKPAPQDD
jgi:hypothetical protein